MNHVTVIALGPGSRELLTLGALETMRKAECLILRTAKCDAARYLAEQRIAFESLDPLYEQAEDFDGLNYLAGKSVDFVNEKLLIDGGILDSFDIISIVAEIDAEWGIQIPPQALIPEHFNSARAMYALLRQLQGGGNLG